MKTNLSEWVTAVLPVSRPEYLDRVLESLKNQNYYKPDALIVIFDGPDDDYIEVRNKIVGQPYDHVLCVKSNNLTPAFAISERRQHIANIHNQARSLIERPGLYNHYVFTIEDDGILPPNALSDLLAVIETHREGMVTGVELGRWGVPYVGAWKVDNIFTPTLVTSMENKVGQNLMEPIDGCGLYCALVRADLYVAHEFDSVNGLGPDVNLGLYCRQQGYNNSIVWSVPVTHLTNLHGIEVEIPATDNSYVVSLDLQGTTWHQTKVPTGQASP